jgi:hypothetical protein
MVNLCFRHLMLGNGPILFPHSGFFSSDTKTSDKCAVIQLVILSCTKLNKYKIFLTKLGLRCVCWTSTDLLFNFSIINRSWNMNTLGFRLPLRYGSSSSLFRVLTQRWLVVIYRRFGINSRSHIQQWSSPRLLDVDERRFQGSKPCKGIKTTTKFFSITQLGG